MKGGKKLTIGAAEANKLQRLKLIIKVGGATKMWKKQASNAKHRFNILREWL